MKGLPSKFKQPSEMTNAELRDWKRWAKDEISEYQDFIEEVDAELLKR